MSLGECQLVCLKDGTDGIAFCPTISKTSITIGSKPECDIRITHEDIKDEHFRIYVDSAEKVIAEFIFLYFTGASPLFSLLFVFLFSQKLGEDC